MAPLPQQVGPASISSLSTCACLCNNFESSAIHAILGDDAFQVMLEPWVFMGEPLCRTSLDRIAANILYHSIYKEIGPGRRIALSKVAVEHFEKTGRPLRIAIDISIWLFQIQSGKGMHHQYSMCIAILMYCTRRHKSSAANFLLSPSPPHLAVDTPSLRL